MRFACEFLFGMRDSSLLIINLLLKFTCNYIYLNGEFAKFSIIILEYLLAKTYTQQQKGFSLAK